VALLPLLTVLVLAVAVAGGVALARRSPPSAESTVAAARQHARLTSTAAVVLAGVAALVTGATSPLNGGGAGSLGRQALLVPICFGVAHTVVLALGELTWPRPEGQVRRARLVRRGLLDAGPRWLLRLTCGAAVAAVVTIGGGALLADADGRSFSQTSADGRMTSIHSPFAGLAYGRPTAIGLLALAAAVVTALWIVANRPAVATDDERIEGALRRASAHRVLRGAATAVLVVTGGLLAVSGMAVAGVATGVLSAAGTGAALLGVAGALAGVVVLAVRAPGVPADRPSPAVPAG
jgi:hypothetical protein